MFEESFFAALVRNKFVWESSVNSHTEGGSVMRKKNYGNGKWFVESSKTVNVSSR